ncbi:tail fiber domain-containing protein [bacterium]|nr:tail fiber domain-containing protein [bacterium]
MNGRLLPRVWFASLFAVQISWAQLTITSSGQIGIGITSPASDTKLHVQHTGAGLRAGYFEGGALGLHAKAIVAGSGNRIALTGQASGGSGTNYGVYGSGSGGATNYAGYFVGNVTVTGTFSNPSDDNLKENIDSLSAVLPALTRLRPIRFHFRKDADYQDLNLPPGRQYGFSAQELESVFPDLVRTESHLSPEDLEKNGEPSPFVYKSINYLGLIPLLVEAIKEQQAMITELQDEVKRLKQE